MFARVFAVAMNTYREAVRARVLFGIMAAAVATTLYSLVLSAMSLRNETRIISDIASASTSLFAVLVAIVLGATSLYREIELKTIYPILTRKLTRAEYVVAKYLGILATVFTFVLLNASIALLVMGFQGGVSPVRIVCVALVLSLLLAGSFLRFPLQRSLAFLPWAVLAFVTSAAAATPLAGERQIILAQVVLTLGESAIVAGVAMLFSSFSSPFLTAVFSFGVFLVGRSADTLGNLPVRIFGSAIRTGGIVLSHVFPNLNAFVPARPLLLGQVDNVSVAFFVARATGVAALYAVLLLSLSALIFRKRDFP